MTEELLTFDKLTEKTPDEYASRIEECGEEERIQRKRASHSRYENHKYTVVGPWLNWFKLWFVMIFFGSLGVLFIVLSVIYLWGILIDGEAQKELFDHIFNTLFISGTSLYFGEILGEKK